MWFLSSEVANLYNFRVWPGANLRLMPLLLLWAVKKIFYRISQNETRFLYLWPKMVSWTKFEGTLFSDPKCSGPLLQTLPVKSYLSGGPRRYVLLTLNLKQVKEECLDWSVNTSSPPFFSSCSIDTWAFKDTSNILHEACCDDVRPWMTSWPQKLSRMVLYIICSVSISTELRSRRTFGPRSSSAIK